MSIYFNVVRNQFNIFETLQGNQSNKHIPIAHGMHPLGRDWAHMSTAKNGIHKKGWLMNHFPLWYQPPGIPGLLLDSNCSFCCSMRSELVLGGRVMKMGGSHLGFRWLSINMQTGMLLQHTVGGRNPAPNWMVETLGMMEETTSQLVIRISSRGFCNPQEATMMSLDLPWSLVHMGNVHHYHLSRS